MFDDKCQIESYSFINLKTEKKEPKSNKLTYIFCYSADEKEKDRNSVRRATVVIRIVKDKEDEREKTAKFKYSLIWIL